MQIRIFTIPIFGGDPSAEDMNAFLRSKKVLQVDQQLINHGQSSAWCFCVRYVEDNSPFRGAREKVDYKEVLDAESFERFSTFRKIRKEIADDEGIPAFSVFTDQELSEMAKVKDLSATSMKAVKGIGEKKMEKYGRFFISKPGEDEKS